MKPLFHFPICKTLFAGCLLFLNFGNLSAQDDGPKPRGIVPVFESARPTVSATAQAQVNRLPGKPAVSKPPGKPAAAAPTYNRISQKINSGKIGKEDRPKRRPPTSRPPNRPSSSNAQTDIQLARAQQIGVTLWKLLTTNYKGINVAAGDDEYLPQIHGGRTRYLTPARVSLDTLFQPGDYVRLAIEAGKRGYLYVVDQEMYADGSLGEAYLVFPSKRLRNGANLIAPGSPVELPDLTNNPFYFELRPQSQDGKPLAAEVLSVIITDRPIAGLAVGEQPSRISEATLAAWRKKWAGRAEIFEAENVQRKGYSKAEREAGSGKQKLTAADPLPQTVFLLEANRNGGALVTVPLWYGNEE